MLTKFYADKIFNYLKKNNFDIQNVHPKTRDLMFDREILNEINKKLKYEDQIFYVKDVLLLELVNVKNAIDSPNNTALERLLGKGQKHYTLLKTNHIFGVLAYDPDIYCQPEQENFCKNHPNINQNRKVYQITDNDALIYSFDIYAKIDEAVVYKTLPLQNILKKRLDFITRDQLHYLQKIIAFQDKVNEIER